MVGTSISHYKIVAELGRGGMGVVYRAEDARLGRTVALKFLADHLAQDQVSRDRFMQEARASAALTHTNIATLYDVEEDDGRLFITMEFVEGHSLKELLDTGPIDLPVAIDYATQIARGLERAHEADIVHRDIKPANLMVTGRGELKILDFGLAKLGAGVGLSQTGSTIGTAAYMSPEQIRGERVDRRTDLWSLGVVFYELLTSRRPFLEEYEHALYYSIMNADHKPVSDVEPGLGDRFDSILQHLLTKSPDERFNSASDVLAALHALSHEREARTVLEFLTPKAEPAVDSTDEPAEQSAGQSAGQSTSTISAVSEGERRPITILYGELDWAEDLYDEFEPEEVHELSQEYLTVCHAQIRKFGGRPARALGEELNAYFGYPNAREDDAVLAVRCGLAILAEVSRLSETRAVRREPGLGIRIAVHTGLAVVREDEGDVRVLGRAAGVAPKMITNGPIGSVSVSRATQEICRGFFEFEDQGTLQIRGSRGS
ncbi:MAG: protein kinase, partial [Rhodothermia bacterium]